LIEDTDSQRMGTNWHELHEKYADAMPHVVDPEQGVTPEEVALDAVVRLLNDRYVLHKPVSKTDEEWAMERQILLTSFIGYQWYYQNDPVEVLASEVPFELPLKSPKVGMNLPVSEVVRVGRIDHIIRWQGSVCALERKSTSRSIAPDSDYWDKAKKDSQVSQYACAFRDLNLAGLLPESVNAALYGNYEQRAEGQTISATSSGSLSPEQGVEDKTETPGDTVDFICKKERMHDVSREAETLSAIPSSQPGREVVYDRVHEGHSQFGPDLGGDSEVRHTVCQLPLVPACRGQSDVRFSVLYDVWHKPTIKPATLTQAETAAFLKPGEIRPGPHTYCGQEFEIKNESEPDGPYFTINGTNATIERGKKGFAIRETVEMYGARLLEDIYERPEHYFVRREIARTDADLAHFERQAFAIYQSQKLAEKYNAWVENEQQCRATFACPYIPICYGPGADAVCDGKTTPSGFKRIFVQLTVNEQETD
jgi:hypothetical protein